MPIKYPLTFSNNAQLLQYITNFSSGIYCIFNMSEHVCVVMYVCIYSYAQPKLGKT